jgi:hypothetical protein
VEAAVAEEGWKMVLLLRLSPIIPFALLNYFLSLTSIPFWDYAWASGLGIVPGHTLPIRPSRPPERYLTGFGLRKSPCGCAVKSLVLLAHCLEFLQLCGLQQRHHLETSGASLSFFLPDWEL